MVIVITTTQKNERTGKTEVVVSHGINERTGRTVILPCEAPETIGAVFHHTLREYVLIEGATSR